MSADLEKLRALVAAQMWDWDKKGCMREAWAVERVLIVIDNWILTESAKGE